MKSEKKLDIETARRKFIERAEKVKVERRKRNKAEWRNVLLGIKISMIDKIDTIIDGRMGMTRSGWILDAIEEKMEREEKKLRKLDRLKKSGLIGCLNDTDVTSTNYKDIV